MKIRNILLVSMIMILAGCSSLSASIIGASESKVIFENDSGTHVYGVSVADTYDERKMGLMYEENLDENRGMIFVFVKKDKFNFWMKNTLIPLDMIFIDEDMKVVDFIENAEPCKVKNCPHYTSKTEALYVLELNGGQANKIDLEIGDKVKFENILTDNL
jgi:uncharacterized membrane protein (UPF0127 family)